MKNQIIVIMINGVMRNIQCYFSFFVNKTDLSDIECKIENSSKRNILLLNDWFRSKLNLKIMQGTFSAFLL